MKKIISIIFILILILGFNNINAKEINSSNTIIVDDDGGEDYTTISEALEAASNGDKIIVRPGKYDEDLNINKSVFLLGTNIDNTIINTSNYVFVNSDNVRIEDFGIISKNCGIRIESNFTTIYNNKINSSWYGVWLVKSNKCHINCNIFEKTGVSAIWMYMSQKNEIANNEIGLDYHETGIKLGVNCTDNIIAHNLIENIYGCAFNLVNGASNNIIVTNVIKDNYGGIFLDSETKDNFIYHNNLINNSFPYYDHSLNAVDNGDNIWDNGKEGNYWDNFDNSSEGAWDNDSNGIIDSALYIINETFEKSENKDNYPLANPYSYIHPDFKLSFKKFSFNKLVGYIENEKNEDYYNVEWTMSIKGGLFNQINVKETGIITMLNKKETITVETGVKTLRGFGKVDIYIEANTYGFTSGHHTSGFIIGRFLFV